jgi:large subunit ribosomal protein L4
LKKLARKSALTYKAKDNNIIVLEDFKMESPKTKGFLEILNNLKVADKKTLIIIAESNKNIYLSSRNLSQSKVVTVSELNTYDILNATNIVLAEGSLKAIEETLLSN